MKNFYKSNTFLAIVSVICAIIIWIYVVYEVNPLYETWVEDVPVQCVNTSSLFDDGSLVLVNENSASASEIFSSVIKETGRGKVVGVNTYGKGSIQRTFILPNNAGANLTIGSSFSGLKNNATYLICLKNYSKKLV